MCTKVVLEYEFDSVEDAEKFICKITEMKAPNAVNGVETVDGAYSLEDALEAAGVLKAVERSEKEYQIPLLPVSLLFSVRFDYFNIIEDYLSGEELDSLLEGLEFYTSVRLEGVEVHSELSEDEELLLRDIVGMVGDECYFDDKVFYDVLHERGSEWPYHFLSKRHDEFAKSLQAVKENLGIIMEFLDAHPDEEEAIFSAFE